MTRILVTGASGQVGTALLKCAATSKREVLAATRAALDLTDRDAVNDWVARVAGGTVINTAAYTAVDKAETESSEAFAVNRDGAFHLAAACAKHDARLLHISTDYVFDGTKDGAYLETDSLTPLGVYGRSKAEGEAAVMATLPGAIIVRTAWVFSATGANFVRTMLRLARERTSLRVVADQRGCPTSAQDLARALLELSAQRDASGIFHYCGEGETTWHGFAEAIVAAARERTKLAVEHVEAITTADYPTAAQRPANSVLDTSRIRALGITPRSWREDLVDVLEELL